MKIIYVVRTLHHATELERKLGGRSADFRVMYPGSCVTGYRADRVLVASDTLRAMQSEPLRRWWHESVLPRLTPAGQVIEL